MRRRSLPAGSRRRWNPFVRRLDAAAAWINPFLMTIAAMLLIVDLSYAAALLLARLPVTHIQALPPADHQPVRGVSISVQ